MKPFVVKSNCCKAQIAKFATHDIFEPYCTKCNKRCEVIRPKTKHERFQHSISNEIEELNYNEPDKAMDEIRNQKLSLLKGILVIWEDIYFNNNKI